MRGYDENNVWVDEPITEAQRAILGALGFPVPEGWSPDSWTCGAFARDGIPVVVRHLPYLPAVNEALKAAGFRWDPSRKEWSGEDRTRGQVEVIQALHYCAGRYYPGDYPHFAVFVGGSVAEGRPARDGSPPPTGGRPLCPVRVGAYA